MSDKFVPDAQTRAKSVQRLQEICLMFDKLNVTLDAAIASAEKDLVNSPHYIRRMEMAASKDLKELT